MDNKLFNTPRFRDSENFLELSYDELQERNTKLKMERRENKSPEYFADKLIAQLHKESSIKAVTVCFSDMEGKLHMLDYNKAFLLESPNNLTFDGSSIHGFTMQRESDLRLSLDWASLRWLPADIFGAGKVMIFADVCDREGKPYEGDFRSNLKILCESMKADHGMTVDIAPEIEGFLFEGENAEHTFDEKIGFKLATQGGYFNSLPQDRLRLFIDRLAEATRAMGFENEKDHPEVAPSQFEMTYKYTDALRAADQVQIYKITARQIAKRFGFTASFLPKPITNINGSGMHTNLSISQKGKNIFYDSNAQNKLSENANRFVAGILYHGSDICLALNPSVNSYRRLDPHFEAPNEIKVSPIDRGSMIRIPIGNEKSARIEVRTVAPDANPYMVFYLILKAGLKGMFSDKKIYSELEKVFTRPVKKMPGTISEAISSFKRSEFIKEVMNEENRKKFIALKEGVAHRSPYELGKRIKNGEVWYHHEVANQILWNSF